MTKKIMTGGYDLRSNPIHCVLGHYLLSRLVPLGNYRNGAGLKCLLVLSVCIYLGRPLFWLVTRCERLMARLERIFVRS